MAMGMGRTSASDSELLRDVELLTWKFLNDGQNACIPISGVVVGDEIHFSRQKVTS